MSYLLLLFRCILSSYLWISTSAMALVISSFSLMNIIISPWKYVLIVGVYTFVAYQYFISPKRDHKGYAVSLLLFAVFFIIYLYSFNIITTVECLIIVQAAVVSFLYQKKITIPFRRGLLFSMQGLGATPLKPFVVAYVWICITVVFPTIECIHLNESYFYVVCIERFLYVFSLCFVYDIKDIATDRENGLKTYSTLLSKRTMFLLFLSALALSSVVALLTYELTIAITISVSHGLILMSFRRMYADKNKQLFYLGWVDGHILLQSLLIILTASS